MYSNWNRFELHYDIADIKEVDVFNNALMHIKENIPSFENDINQIQFEVGRLNQKINENRAHIRSKVEVALARFSLVSDSEGPFILHKLQWYWFEKLLYGYRNNGIWYNELISHLETFDNEIKEEEGFLKIGARAVARSPIDKKEFVSSVMELVKDYEIWISILGLVRAREEIGDKINTLTRQIYDLVNEINNDKYRITLTCCPSVFSKPSALP